MDSAIGGGGDTLLLNLRNGLACESFRKQSSELVSWSLTLLPVSGADIKMKDDCNASLLNSILIENYI